MTHGMADQYYNVCHYDQLIHVTYLGQPICCTLINPLRTKSTIKLHCYTFISSYMLLSYVLLQSRDDSRDLIYQLNRHDTRCHLIFISLQ